MLRGSGSSGWQSSLRGRARLAWGRARCVRINRREARSVQFTGGAAFDDRAGGASASLAGAGGSLGVQSNPAERGCGRRRAGRVHPRRGGSLAWGAPGLPHDLTRRGERRLRVGRATDRGRVAPNTARPRLDTDSDEHGGWRGGPRPRRVRGDREARARSDALRVARRIGRTAGWRSRATLSRRGRSSVAGPVYSFGPFRLEAHERRLCGTVGGLSPRQGVRHAPAPGRGCREPPAPADAHGPALAGQLRRAEQPPVQRLAHPPRARRGRRRGAANGPRPGLPAGGGRLAGGSAVARKPGDARWQRFPAELRVQGRGRHPARVRAARRGAADREGGQLAQSPRAGLAVRGLAPLARALRAGGTRWCATTREATGSPTGLPRS